MSELSHGASIELNGLRKAYGDAIALNGITLTIPAGEFVTLLGPSGSGKTTTLNMIAGFARPDAGEVLMDGNPIQRLPPHKRNIGMVFQNYALFPHMTVQENVAFPLKQRGIGKSDIATKVKDSLDLVGLTGLGRRYPRELSGGQQQRVALARALVFEPRVLLLDEPLGALDKRLREGLQLEFMRIHRELGITFLYVTHDQEEALVMSDRIAVFSDGGIEQVGAADELYERPSTLFVAQFLGDSNVLRGRLVTGGGGSRLVCDHYELIAPAASATDGLGAAALVVRPERVRLSTGPSDRREGTNTLGGVVREVIYLGGHRRLVVEVSERQRLLVQEQAGHGSGTDVGSEVLATWDCDDAVLLPDSTGTDALDALATLDALDAHLTT